MRTRMGFLTLGLAALSWLSLAYSAELDLGEATPTLDTAPARAILISPSGTVTNPTTTYTWNAVPTATWYYLWVNDSATSTGQIKMWFTAEAAGCSAGTGTCSVSPTTVLSTGVAQWWIQTWNSAGYGPWSNPLSFTVSGNSSPGKATLVSPSGNVTTTTPTYIWNAVPTASWYYLWVNDSTTSTGKIKTWFAAEQAGCSSGTGSCSVSPNTSLSPGEGQWWIQTWNSAGYGPWSDSLTFTVTRDSPPGKVTLVSPSGEISTAVPTYIWNAVPTASWYYLWVNDSTTSTGKIKTWVTAEAAGCLLATGTCSVTPAIELSAGPAQWWIQGWNRAGLGPWSDAKIFVVALMPPQTDNVGDEASKGTLTLIDAPDTRFNPLKSTITYRVTGARFSPDKDSTTVLLNSELVPAADISLTPETVVVPLTLKEGSNELDFVSVDEQGGTLSSNVTLWAGSRTLTVRVVDENNAPVTGATVTASLADDATVAAKAITSSGVVVFSNIPDATISLEAVASGNRYASIAVTGSAGNVQVQLRGFQSASNIDNNDFRLGLAGWNIGSAPVTLIPHREDSADAGSQDAGGNLDLQLQTLGEGPQSISRTFQAKTQTKFITVRYKFITSEIPGGYFGSQYNDQFSISVRSKNSGGLATAANSMNGLGLSAFTTQGETAWHDLTLAVPSGTDLVQLDVSVTNVGDELFDSAVLIHYVSEGSFAIESILLTDADPLSAETNKVPNDRMQYLSVSDHNYYGGVTRVYGTVRIRGADGDALTSLDLEVLEGTSVIATSTLAEGMSDTLLRPFGSDETIEISEARLLFKLPAAMLSQTDSAQNGELTLRIRAVSRNGERAVKDAGIVNKLVLFTGSRFGSRDVGSCLGLAAAYPCGGDDWVLPAVRKFIESFSGIQWNDFSNMNGGPFPKHALHRRGVDIDGLYSGYLSLDAETAQTMIEYLNQTDPDMRVGKVFVAYKRQPQNAFWRAIESVTLADDRKAASVIRPHPGHSDHFHWTVEPIPK